MSRELDQASLWWEEWMTIDIDKLSEPELIDLNHRIVERLRFFQQMRAHRQMLEFKIGDWVRFEPEGHGTIKGMLTRYNKKSVTVIAEDGRQWNVAPALLSKIVAPGAAARRQSRSNVIRLK
jgi:hypothetical protein